jgi:outer membrane autotransporter protein
MSKSKLLLSAAAIVAFSGSAAMAADLYVPPAAPVVSAPAASNWDGPYIGASVGYGWGTADATSTDPSLTTSTSGWLVGAQLGYNFHVADSLVLGVEGNVDWTNETGSLPNLGSYTVGWDGSLRARLGLDAGQWMPYVEAGVAFANATAAATGGSPSFSNTHTGWTVGAGVEVMLADNLSANVEYRYNNYGSQTYNGVPISFNDSQIRLGLNYHF